jgi:hypothetical protein
LEREYLERIGYRHRNIIHWKQRTGSAREAEMREMCMRTDMYITNTTNRKKKRDRRKKRRKKVWMRIDM